jgi:hypothetical protein
MHTSGQLLFYPPIGVAGEVVLMSSPIIPPDKRSYASRLPKHYRRDLDELKTLSAKLNQRIENSTFYKYSYFHRVREVRRLKRLYSKLVGPISPVKLHHILAASLIFVVGSSCNLEDVLSGIESRQNPATEEEKNVAPSVSIKEGDVTLANGEKKTFTAEVTDPDEEDTHFFTWYVDDEKQSDQTADTFDFARDPFEETNYKIRVEVEDGQAFASDEVTATVGRMILTPSFGAREQDPFGFPAGYANYMNPAFVDIDDDGDMDLFIGDRGGTPAFGDIEYYENGGSSTQPAFGSIQQQPFDLDVAGTPSGYHSITFSDLDDDGDYDLLSGTSYGSLYYYENKGNKNAPSFPSWDENFGASVGYYSYAAPAFADIDNDGDYDLFIGTYDDNGSIVYYENTGTKKNPAFTYIGNNPFGISTPYQRPTPFFADIDNDGDLDLFQGDSAGTIRFQENIGDASNPIFDTRQEDAFGMTLGIGEELSSPALSDIDGDYDLDMFVGINYAHLRYFKNTSME